MTKYKEGDKVKCVDGTYNEDLILTVSHIERDEHGNSGYDVKMQCETHPKIV